jgi:hypothetical protein
MNIFISYRREDSGGHAGRLYDSLGAHFGKDNVFVDHSDIEPGQDFGSVIAAAVGSCDLLIAVIGDQWLTLTGREVRRLDDPNDFVRKEICTAIERGIAVIPVLVQGAAMPRTEDLPDSLKPLTQRNALEITDSRWDHDVARLIRAIENLTGTKPRRWQQFEGFRPLLKTLLARPLITFPVTAALLTGAYFVYKGLSPGCGQIFEETTLSVRAKAEIIKTKGEIFIGKEKVQELTSSSQKVGQHLKTCCIVLRSGQLNPDQFQRCTETAQNYEAVVTNVVAALDNAQTAKRNDDANLVKAHVKRINSELNAAKGFSVALEKQVADIAKSGSTQSKTVPQSGPEEAKQWEISPNPKLKSLGRVVVSVPREVDIYVEIREPQEDKRLANSYAAKAFDLLPGQYEVKIMGATVASVPVQPGMDTRIRTGVFNIITDSYWELYDQTKTKVAHAYSGKKVGLPVGGYQLKIAGRFAEVIIKDGQVSDF